MTLTVFGGKQMTKTNKNGYDAKGYKTTKHFGLKIHKDGNKFLFDFMLENKRFRKTFNSAKTQTPTDKLKSAYNALESFRDETIHAKTITADANATINDYFNILKDEAKWSANTLYKYTLYYNRNLAGALGTKKIKDVKPKHFTDYNKTISHLSLSQQKKSYELLQPLFNRAVEDDVIVKSPIKKSHVPKRNQQSEKKVIVGAVEKYRTIYKAINQLFNSTDVIQYTDDAGKDKQIFCEINPHHLAIFLFGFHGRRQMETLNLQWNDIDFINNQYRVKKETSKINQDMIFTLPADVRDALSTFADTAGDVFNVKNIDRHYKYIRIISGLDEFTFHWLRNLSVSALSANGVATADLSAMLGHSDINTLNKYLSLQRASATANTADASLKLLS